MSKKWIVKDRYGNTIYLTNERWEHIIDPANHPEMSGYGDHLKKTIRLGKRQQGPFDPRKYRYFRFFDDLIGDNNCIIAVVIFKLTINEKGNTVENNFVLTAYQKHVTQKR